MSLREKINENPQVAAGVGGGIAVLAIIFMLLTLLGGGDGVPRVDPNDAQLYYTTDDGATHKPGPAAERMTPGIVQAHVFDLGDGKTQVVGYLERWTPEGVTASAELSKAIKANHAAEAKRLDAAVAAGREVKKPKVGAWVKGNTPEAAKITSAVGPKGEEDLSEVYPPPKK